MHHDRYDHLWKGSKRDLLLDGELDEPEEGPDKDASPLEKEDPERPLQEDDFEIATYEEGSVPSLHDFASTG